MVKPSDIVKHLKTYLPIFTDLFTETLTVSAATMGAGNIVTVTSAGHGLTVGKKIIVIGGTVRNPLTASTLDGSTVQFSTVYDHDLIKPSQVNDDYTLTLAGFGGVWDGEHTIADVPNRRNFNVALPTGEVAAPAVDESQYLIESITTGVYDIATVPDVDTFTIDLSDLPDLAIGAIDDLTILSEIRIAMAANFKRATEIYSAQDDQNAYLFVIMADVDISKDRHTLNDSVAGMTRQDMNLLRIQQNFATTVFIPTTNDLSGGDAQDIAYGSLYTALLSSLFGFPFDNQIINYFTVPVGHGVGEYNTAYYVHVYEWQAPTVINYENSFEMNKPDYAFRDILQTLQIFADEEAEMIADINLDDEQL